MKLFGLVWLLVFVEHLFDEVRSTALTWRLVKIISQVLLLLVSVHVHLVALELIQNLWIVLRLIVITV